MIQTVQSRKENAMADTVDTADTAEPSAAAVGPDGRPCCRYDFYAAGPFFDDREVSSMEGLERVLEERGKVLFKPRFASDISVVGPRQCFEDDCGGILASRAVIANLIDDDPGTMFEIGFAYGHGIPVYGYHDGLQPGRSVNLMIAQSVRAIFAGPDDLAHWLDTGEHADLPIRQF